LSGFGAFLFLPKVDRALLGCHTSYEYAYNKEGNQKEKNTFPEHVEKINPRGEAELNCERSELLPSDARQKKMGCRIRAKDVALANPKCDPRTHGPKISLFPGLSAGLAIKHKTFYR
jgi:hypothetical protein